MPILNNVALTIQNCYKQILHALHGAEPASRTKLEITNEAGSLLYTMHRWRFLDNSLTTFSLVSGRDYIELPLDFAGILTEPQPVDTSVFAGCLEIVAPDELSVYKSNPTIISSNYYKGSVMFVPSTLTGAPPTPRLFVTPPPAADQLDAFQAQYKRQWFDLSEDVQQIAIPQYCRSLFLELLSAVALGKEEESGGTVDDRVTKLMQGGLFSMAKHQDALIQIKHGQMSNAPMQIAYPPGTYFTNNPAVLA